MDLSDKIKFAAKESLNLEEKLKPFQLLDMYSGEDKVVNFKELVNKLKEQSVKSESIKTEIPILDEKIDGLREGQLIVLSAPTGSGKTAFLQSLTKTFSDKDIPCLWFSYEVNPLEFAERFENMGCDIPVFYVPAQNKDSNLDWFKLRCLEGISKFKTKIVFIDHLHFLMDMKFLQKVNTSIAIGILMRELKKFALEYGLIIFLVAHLTKTKLEIVPTIDDLRDSSFIGQESDFVWIMWRHQEKDKTSPTGFNATNEARLVIAKNRWNGNLGYVRMLFNKGRFTELTDLGDINL